jgi:hypothetical protein
MRLGSAASRAGAISLVVVACEDVAGRGGGDQGDGGKPRRASADWLQVR